MDKNISINIEYERIAYYSDGLEPETVKEFGDDYIDWDEEEDGELNLDNIIIKIFNNTKILSIREDDVIDFERAESLDETQFNILIINASVEHLYYDDEDEEDEEIEDYDITFKQEEIEESIGRLLDEGQISLSEY